MNENGLIISITEARNILGDDADGLSDNQIAELIITLDVIGKDSLHQALKKRREEDALALAQLIYDIYRDKKKFRK